MSQFDERGQAFEKKEAMDAEKRFKVESVRNRLVGKWAAGLLGYDEQTTYDYIKAVIAADFSKPGDGPVVEKIHSDLNAAGKTITEADVRDKIDEFYRQATDEVSSAS